MNQLHTLFCQKNNKSYKIHSDKILNQLESNKQTRGFGMGMFDDMTSSIGSAGDEMQARFEELCDREASGTLEDVDRAELQQLRENLGIG